jgi:hypothetical protein
MATVAKGRQPPEATLTWALLKSTPSTAPDRARVRASNDTGPGHTTLIEHKIGASEQTTIGELHHQYKFKAKGGEVTGASKTHLHTQAHHPLTNPSANGTTAERALGHSSKKRKA